MDSSLVGRGGLPGAKRELLLVQTDVSWPGLPCVSGPSMLHPGLPLGVALLQPMGTRGCGITPAVHAGGPVFNPQCVRFALGYVAVAVTRCHRHGALAAGSDRLGVFAGRSRLQRATSHIGPVATKWVRRWSSKPKIAGSSPARVTFVGPVFAFSRSRVERR